MRYLAIDLGDKRTGLATGDDETRFVAPLEVVEIPRAAQEFLLIERIAAVARAHDCAALVVGLPLNMDGSEGERATLVRDFATRLAVALPESALHFQDERLSSFAAEQAMARSGRTHGQKKRLRDALAAAEVLRDFLRRGEPRGTDDD